MEMKAILKKIDQKTFKVLPKVKRVLLRIRPSDYYINKSRLLIKEKRLLKANNILDKGLKKFKHNYCLNHMKATIEMEYGDKELAGKYWGVVIEKYPKSVSENDYIEASKNSLSNRKAKEALSILEIGIAYYPASVELLQMLTQQYVNINKWEEAVSTLTQLFISDEYELTIKDYINFSYAYFSIGKNVQAEYIIQDALKKYGNHSELILFYVELAVLLKKWNKASELIEYLNVNYNIDYSDDEKTLFGIVNQLIGNLEKADYFFDNVLTSSKLKRKDKPSYKRVIIYDNGETRISFYKRNTKTNKVIITFDSINMTWDRPSFGYKLLSEQNVDIIAVQKRKKKTYHQDLSLEEFLNAVKALVSCYSIRISYGFSLGAYLAVYYTGELGCNILALAPRLSIHPVYGKSNAIKENPFYHEHLLRSNPHVRPIIVYDPKDKFDSIFVDNEILRAYPQAHLVKIPYGGHGMAPHLLRMNLLKKFILTVIQEGKVPIYDRRAKVRSANYCRLLGRECLKRKKVKWAKDLADRAYELLPEDPLVVRFMVATLKEEEQYKKAEEYMRKAIKSNPKSLPYRLDLIDLYIEQRRLIKAEKELEILTSIFGEKKRIDRKLIELEEMFKSLVGKHYLKS